MEAQLGRPGSSVDRLYEAVKDMAIAFRFKPGERLNEGSPMKFSHTEAGVRRHAPLFGEHNNYVYGELLGMSEEEIEQLHREGVI